MQDHVQVLARSRSARSRPLVSPAWSCQSRTKEGSLPEARFSTSSLDLGSQSPRWPSDDAAFDGAALAITGRWIQRRETAHKQRKPSRQTDGSRPTTSPAAVGSSSLPPIWKPDGSGLQALAEAGRAQLPQTQSIHPHQAALTISPPTSSTQAKHHDMQHLPSPLPALTPWSSSLFNAVAASDDISKGLALVERLMKYLQWCCLLRQLAVAQELLSLATRGGRKRRTQPHPRGPNTDCEEGEPR